LLSSLVIDLDPPGEDGKVRADRTAQVAARASVRILDHGRVVAFGVKVLGKNQDFHGTEFHAESASLAHLPFDENFPLKFLDFDRRFLLALVRRHSSLPMDK
jgi:hypothetical protein